LSRLIRAGLFIILGVATFVVGYDSSTLNTTRLFGIPDPWYKVLIVTCLSILGMAFLIELVDSAIRGKFSRNRERIDLTVGRVLFPFWEELTSTVRPAGSRDWIGLHVWLVPSWHWILVPRWIRNHTPGCIRSALRTPRLWCAAGFRLKRQQSRVAVSFRRDVGVIGQCWRRREVVYRNLVVEWGHRAVSEREWKSFDKNRRMGLTYNQYKHLIGRYGTIIAVPIFHYDSVADDPEFIGCVVADSSFSDPIELDSVAIKDLLTEASESVARALTARS